MNQICFSPLLEVFGQVFLLFHGLVVFRTSQFLEFLCFSFSIHNLASQVCISECCFQLILFSTLLKFLDLFSHIIQYHPAVFLKNVISVVSSLHFIFLLLLLPNHPNITSTQKRRQSQCIAYFKSSGFITTLSIKVFFIFPEICANIVIFLLISSFFSLHKINHSNLSRDTVFTMCSRTFTLF